MELKINEFLKKEDIDMLNLRHLYSHHSYVHYKMNKFEEYDLYVENKEFLASNRIITFTDTNGKLMALKPDVTLSIIKNYQDVPGVVQKLYYNENVYRMSRSTKTYKEIMQMGLECIGDLDVYNISEVLLLAIKSLEILSDKYLLDISHVGVIKGIIRELGLNTKDERHFLSLLQEKNGKGIRNYIPNDLADALTTEYGPLQTVIERIKPLTNCEEVKKALNELEELGKLLPKELASHINLDFSLVNDMTYYNGVLFKGYISGIPFGILSGGQYDDLMEKLGKNAKAIGFALNLDLLEGQYNQDREYDADILLLYDKAAEVRAVSEAVHNLMEKGYIVNAQKQIPPKQRFKKILKLENGGLVEIDANRE